MVDENETNSAGDTAVTEAPVEAIAAKKKRAPRRSPAEIAAAAAAKSKGKTSGTTDKPAKPATANPSALTNSTIKGSAKAKLPAKSAKAEIAAAPAADEFMDLLQLEEENKGLRKALSEKLRAENADLRKRLGQA